MGHVWPVNSGKFFRTQSISILCAHKVSHSPSVSFGGVPVGILPSNAQRQPRFGGEKKDSVEVPGGTCF